jgi:hypothetical protein
MSSNEQAATPASHTEFSVERMSEYYLELERLLARVEGSATHYQTLGIERAATSEDVKGAYSHAVAMLHPSYQVAGLSLPDEMVERVDRAFERIAQAFSVLANYGRRIEYDNSLSRRSATPLAFDIPTVLKGGQPEVIVPVPERVAETNISQAKIAGGPGSSEVFSETAKELSEDNRRRCARLKLSVPVRVTGHEKQTGKWSDMAQTINVNRLGISILTKHRMLHGRVVHLTLPLPVKLRNHGHADPSYSVYAIVRRVEPPNNGLRVVGLEFLSEHPPRGYLDAPWRTFRTTKWAGPDRRQEPRRPCSQPVEVVYLTDDFDPIEHQLGLTENVCSVGARVYVEVPPPEFDWVKVIGRNNGFESNASLRNRFTGKDGYERLCLQFLDQRWPQ